MSKLYDSHSAINTRWDTPGLELYEETRSACYYNTHVILIVFSFTEPASLANVEAVWVKEMKLDALKNAPVSEIISFYIYMFTIFVPETTCWLEGRFEV